MVRPWREKGPGRPWAAQCPPPPLSGAWCGRLRLECLGRAEAAARNMAATPSPNLFDATLQLETLTRLSMTHGLASLSVTLGKGRVQGWNSEFGSNKVRKRLKQGKEKKTAGKE